MITEEEFGIIGHSLGINIYHAKKSKLKRDKKLPNEYYRNFFQGNEGHTDYPILMNLKKRGLVSQREQFKQSVFHITDEGIKEFEIKFFIDIIRAK